MKITRSDFGFYALVVLCLAAIAFQLVSAKRPQPVISDVWPKLAQSKVDVDYLNRTYSINVTPEVEAMEARTLVVDGFIMPLESEPSFTHFLLSSKAPSCPFCLPAAPNELMEVFANEPISWSDQLVTFQGQLHVSKAKNEQGIFFKLFGAMPAVHITPVVATNAATPAMGNVKDINTLTFTELKGEKFVETATIPLPRRPEHPLLIAFWRSDCAPCLKEMEILPEIAKGNADMPIALISLHDAEHTRQRLTPMPKNVQVLVAQQDGKTVLNAFGNTRTLALPYSIMLDRDAILCKKHYGMISPQLIKDWRKVC